MCVKVADNELLLQSEALISGIIFMENTLYFETKATFATAKMHVNTKCIQNYIKFRIIF